MKIEIKNLTKKYGKHVIFDNYDLTINDQSFFLIKGVSGSGKSTLLNIIAMLEPYDSGKVLYDGKEIKKIREFYQNDVSYVFQNFALIENETVYNNFNIIIKIKKLKKAEKLKKFESALEAVGLDKKCLDQKVYELSGGEKQRVALAKIILKQSKLILADEPTASLDNINAEIVLDFFKKLHENKATIIVVSHSNIFDEIADEIINL